MQSARRRQIREALVRVLWATGTALAVLLLVQLVVATQMSANLADYVPMQPDESKNWSAIRTFAVAGFEGGQYTINEIEPVFSFSRYGPHGPWFPALYGSVARFSGWGFTSGLWFNWGLLVLGLVAFCCSVRVAPGTAALISGIVITSWQLVVELLAVSPETLHHVFALLLAACFVNLHLAEAEGKQRLRVVTSALVLVAALFRPTWSFLLIPLLASAFKGKLRFLGAAMGLVAAAGSILVYRLLVPSNPTAPISRLASGAETWSELIGVWTDLVMTSFDRFIDFRNGLPDVSSASPRLLVLVLLIGMLVSVIAELRRRVVGKETSLDGPVLFVFNLLVPLALVILFANIGAWKDARLLAPHVLLAAVFSASLRQYAWLGRTVLVTNLVLLVPFPSRMMDPGWARPPTVTMGTAQFRAIRGPNFGLPEMHDVAISGDVVRGRQALSAMGSITATSVEIENGGDVTFRAGESVRLGEGFSVEAGASFQVEVGPFPEDKTRGGPPGEDSEAGAPGKPRSPPDRVLLQIEGDTRGERQPTEPRREPVPSAPSRLETDFMPAFDSGAWSRTRRKELDGLHRVFAKSLSRVGHGDGWCDTVFVYPSGLDRRLAFLSLPAGFALSARLGMDGFPRELKSRYVLGEKKTVEDLLGDIYPLRELATTQIGTLFEREDVDCTPSGGG